MSLWDDFRFLLIPRSCPVCHHRLQESSEHLLCTSCMMQLPRYLMNRTDDNELIRRVWPSAPFEHGATMFYYRQLSQFHRILMEIKYKGATNLAIGMGRWAAIEMEELLTSIGADALVPVPLSIERKRKRGYNQAELIAKGMSGKMGIPVVNLLKCKNFQKEQKNLTAEKRFQNVMGLYEASIPDEWKGKHLMLVDDVFTTGATVATCGKAIMNADEHSHISFFTLSYAG